MNKIIVKGTRIVNRRIKFCYTKSTYDGVKVRTCF